MKNTGDIPENDKNVPKQFVEQPVLPAERLSSTDVKMPSTKSVNFLNNVSVLLDVLSKLTSLITWPVVVLVIVLIFYSPLRHLMAVLPAKFEASSEITIGTVSLKIQERAVALGQEELASILEGLSPDAIKWILKLGDGNFRIVGSDDGKTGVVQNYYISPDSFVVWRELEEKGLIEGSTMSLGEFEAYFQSLNPIDGKISVTTLTPEQKETLLDNSVRLTPTGKIAYEIILNVIADLIGQQ